MLSSNGVLRYKAAEAKAAWQPLQDTSPPRSSIRVRRYQDERDYSTVVAKTFERFKQGAVNDYRGKFPDGPNIDHVEAAVLDRAACLYPDVFQSVESRFARAS